MPARQNHSHKHMHHDTRLSFNKHVYSKRRFALGRSLFTTLILSLSIGLNASENQSAQVEQQTVEQAQDEWTQAGSEQDEWGDWGDESEQAVQKNYSLAGFFDVSVGRRINNDPAINQSITLGDLRGQVQWDYHFDASTLVTRSDMYYDGVTDELKVQIRELAWQGNLSALGDWGKRWDAKLGQQVLTWGVGDYVFLNDLFPKDFQSFFSGRDDEYLKAPSLSAKFSGYFDLANIDLVITPRFTADNFINGEYFSFYSPQAMQNVAPEFEVISSNEPDDAEYAMRISKSISSTELAAYAYKGFSKSPSSADALGQARFAKQTAYGFSAVSPISAGLAKFEYVYQRADEDKLGNNPLITNSQSKILFGYEQELFSNMTGSAQWYIERIEDHDELLTASSVPLSEAKEYRRTLTTQLRYSAMQDTLILHWFNFYSPSDEDNYMRFRATYSPVDKWKLSGGFNWFDGKKANSFFGQFEDASNVFVSFRYFLSSAS